MTAYSFNFNRLAPLQFAHTSGAEVIICGSAALASQGFPLQRSPDDIDVGLRRNGRFVNARNASCEFAQVANDNCPSLEASVHPDRNTVQLGDGSEIDFINTYFISCFHKPVFVSDFDGVYALDIADVAAMKLHKAVLQNYDAPVRHVQEKMAKHARDVISIIEYSRTERPDITIDMLRSIAQDRVLNILDLKNFLEANLSGFREEFRALQQCLRDEIGELVFEAAKHIHIGHSNSRLNLVRDRLVRNGFEI